MAPIFDSLVCSIKLGTIYMHNESEEA